MAIYGASPSQSYSARRLLLSLLEVPSPVSFSGTFDISENGSHPTRKLKKHHFLAASDAPGLHRRHLGLELWRPAEVQDVRRQTESHQQALGGLAEIGTLQQYGESLARKLKSIQDPYHYRESIVDPVISYWRGEPRLSDWNVDFCRLLHAVTANKAKSTGPRRSSVDEAVQSQVPGTETLLTFFETRELPRPLNPDQPGQLHKATTAEHSTAHFDRRMPYLISHFVPSASALEMNAQLPRIELRFRFSAPKLSGQPREIQLVGLKAILDEQHLNVPIPECAVDLRFSRDVSVVSNIAAATQDGAIHEFWEKLQESVQSGQGALVAPPTLQFKIPHWMMGSQTAAELSAQADQDVEYLFERFQQVQNLRFVPSKANQAVQMLRPEEARDLIEAFPQHYYLTYREIEGGAIHGSQTKLGLRRPLPASPAPNTSEQELAARRYEPKEEPKPPQIDMVEEHEDAKTTATESHSASQESASDPEAQFTTAALQIARLLTLANAGALRGGRVM